MGKGQVGERCKPANSPTNLLAGRFDEPIGALADTDIALQLWQYAGAYHEGSDVDHNQ